MIDVGMLELNRNPENYFAEIEQSAFSPSNIVPGISFSPDKMLQARIFSLRRRPSLSRVGTWYEKLPVNAPKVAVRTYHLDGQMVFDAPKGTDAYYEPNSFGGPVQDSAFAEPPLRIKGDAERYNHRDGNDDYKQPGRSLPAHVGQPEGTALPQHRGHDGGHSAKHHRPAACPFREGRPGLCGRREARAGRASGV